MKADGTYCFIINGASNAHSAFQVFRKQEAKIKALFPSAEFIYVQQQDSIQQIAHQKSAQYSHIIACGGDGTVNQVANGLIGTSAVLGVIPLGSGNDFAREIGVSPDIDEALQTLLEGETKQIDVIKTQRGCFLNTFGIGADGLTNYYATNSYFSKGGLRYFLGGIKALIKSKPFAVDLTFEESNKSIRHSVWMVTLANGTTEGGRYTISPTSILDDGIIEIIVVKDVPRLRLIYEFIKLSIGLSLSTQVIAKYTFKSRVRVHPSERVKAHADGEQVTPYPEYKFQVLRAERHIICNSKK